MATWTQKIAYKYHGAKNWPWADAKVFDFQIVYAGKNTYRGELSYSFWHEGHIHSGIATWDCTQDRDLNMYPKEETVQIQFNPSNPDESYFPEQESLDAAFNLLLAAIALIPIGLLIWYGYTRMNR